MRTRFDRITIDPAVCGGQPCVRGLRILVFVVLRHLAAGLTVEAIVEALPELEAADVPACSTFAAWLASRDPGVLDPAA